MDISSFPPEKQVKLQYWLDVIRQCRASGLTNQAWCEQHNISLKSYYYWLAKIRKIAIEELPRKSIGTNSSADLQSVLLPQADPQFTEISLTGSTASRSSPAAVLHIGTMTVELFEGASSELLTAILKAVQPC